MSNFSVAVFGDKIACFVKATSASGFWSYLWKCMYCSTWPFKPWRSTILFAYAPLYYNLDLTFFKFVLNYFNEFSSFSLEDLTCPGTAWYDLARHGTSRGSLLSVYVSPLYFSSLSRFYVPPVLPVLQCLSLFLFSSLSTPLPLKFQHPPGSLPRSMTGQSWLSVGMGTGLWQMCKRRRTPSSRLSRRVCCRNKC